MNENRRFIASVLPPAKSRMRQHLAVGGVWWLGPVQFFLDPEKNMENLRKTWPIRSGSPFVTGCDATRRGPQSSKIKSEWISGFCQDSDLNEYTGRGRFKFM